LAARFDTLFASASPVSARAEILAEDMAARTTTTTTTNTTPSTPDTEAPSLHLSNFTPFRLNRLATGVTDYLSEVTQGQFGLEIPEWRVIATIGPLWRCTAQHIADSTRMHKTRVSRAIAHLVKRGLVERASNADDRREMELRLTKAGRAMYCELVPQALERERALLSRMSDEQLRAFNEGLSLLEEFLGLA
jgi:DNA-binding MarR family transcriptional regulator